MQLVGPRFPVDIPLLTVDAAQDDPSSRDPVMLENGVTFCFIQHNNVYLMIATKHNCNAASMLLFLHKAVEVSSVALLPLYMRS